MTLDGMHDKYYGSLAKALEFLCPLVLKCDKKLSLWADS